MAFKNIQQLNLRIPEFDKDLNLIRFRELFEQIRLFTVDVNNNVNFNKSAFDAHISNAFNPLLARIDDEATGLDALNNDINNRLLTDGSNADPSIELPDTTIIGDSRFIEDAYDDRNVVRDLDFKAAPAKGATATSTDFNSNAGMQEYHNKVRDYTKDHIDRNNNPHSVTKSQVNLGNVDNVQQATKSEFNTHVNDNTIHFTKASLDKGDVNLGNVDNIQQAAKTDFDTHVQDGSIHFAKGDVDKSDVGLANVTDDAQVKRTEMGVANGVATLDSNTKIPLNQLPDTAKQRTIVVEQFNQLPTENILEGDKGFVTGTEEEPIGDSFIWDGTEWIILAKAEWENVNLQWANITNPPKSAANTPLQDGNVYTTTEADNKFETITNVSTIVGNREYTEDTVVTNGQSLTNSIDALAVELETKVDKVENKGLSANDFTIALKEKLENIDDGAQVNVQSDWEQTNDEADDFIKNKPSIFTQDELTPQKEDPENEDVFIPDFDTEGSLDERYYTQKQLDEGQLDNRYFTQTQLFPLIENPEIPEEFIPDFNTIAQLDNRYYTISQLEDGQLDNRYYTQEETDSFLADKVDVGVLSSNIILYPTSAPADVSGYFKLVTSLDDPDYNSVAQDILTVPINGPAVLLAELISEPNLFIGNPGVINVPVIGQIRKAQPNPDVSARFFFEIYKRDINGVEELLGTSDATQRVNSIIYEEFSASAILNNGVFTETDRVVFKFYGTKVAPQNGAYEFLFGGATPVRALLDVPVSVTLQAGRIFYNDTDNDEVLGDNVQAALDSIDVALGNKAPVVNGKIPADLIPFQFEDVLQGFFDGTDFFETDEFDQEEKLLREQGKLYIDIATNDIYRFDGTQYIVVKEAIGALGEVPDVIFTSLQLGQLLRYDGTNWVNDGLPLENLKNVVITNLGDGQYLKYDNETEKWVNTNLDAPVIDSLDAIDDVDAPTPSSGDIIQYNASTSKWEKNRINFVSATAPTNPYVGDFWFDSSTLVLYVYYDDGDSVQWVNAVSGIVEGQPEELIDLTDVEIITPAEGEILRYNATSEKWENTLIIDGGEF